MSPTHANPIRSNATGRLEWQISRRLPLTSVVVAAAFKVAMLAGATPVSAEEKYFDSAGVRLGYTDEGRGTAVVLIHGWRLVAISGKSVRRRT